MFEITSQSSFSAAHHLLNYNGPCENVHGHNWLVKVSVRCQTLNTIGIGIDFKDLKKCLNRVLDELDHKDLNVVLAASGLNPSSENLARHIFDRMKPDIAAHGCTMHRVEVFETPTNSATYLE